jgi:hypothetical protein
MRRSGVPSLLKSAAFMNIGMLFEDVVVAMEKLTPEMWPVSATDPTSPGLKTVNKTDPVGVVSPFPRTVAVSVVPLDEVLDVRVVVVAVGEGKSGVTVSATGADVEVVFGRVAVAL